MLLKHKYLFLKHEEEEENAEEKNADYI